MLSAMDIKEESACYLIKLSGKGKESIHSLRIWIDSNTEYDTYNKDLIFNFESALKQDL